MTSVYKTLLLLYLLLGWGSANAGQEELRFGVFELKPWFFYEDHQPKGILYEVMQAAAKHHQFRIVPVVVPPRRVGTALIEGLVDVAPIIRIAGEAELIYPEQVKLVVGEQKLFSLTLALVGLKSREFDFVNLQDLERYSVGAIRFHSRLLDGFGIAPQTFTNIESLLKSLYAGRIDLAFSAMPTVAAGAKALGIENQLHIALTLDKRSYATLAWSRNTGIKDPEHLAQVFDGTLMEMVRSGEATRIIQRYSSSDYFQLNVEGALE